MNERFFPHLISLETKLSEVAHLPFQRYERTKWVQWLKFFFFYYFKSYFNGLKFNTVPCVKINETFFF
jgi:hypothetical protein